MVGLSRRQSLLHVGLTGAAVWALQPFFEQSNTPKPSCCSNSSSHSLELMTCGLETRRLAVWCSVDTLQCGVAKVGGSRQVALGRVQTTAVGRQPVEESSSAQTAARQVERVPLHAAGA